MVVESWTTDQFNAIDPNLTVDDQGRWWLTFGSFWSGIKMIPIDPATGRRLGSTMHSLAAYGPGIEAPVLVKRGAWYYLYVSFDRCCQGAASTYRIMVVRRAPPGRSWTARAGTCSPAAARRSWPRTAACTAPATRRSSPTPTATSSSTTTTPTTARRCSASTASATTPPPGPTY
ncbi:family 43 glycosylhydrolase [Micromonospora sp. BRA006-A]|nr:family 43 glycosylhydrolase [Micromonospora sp. BRA006-A]